MPPPNPRPPPAEEAPEPLVLVQQRLQEVLGGDQRCGLEVLVQVLGGQCLKVLLQVLVAAEEEVMQAERLDYEPARVQAVTQLLADADCTVRAHRTPSQCLISTITSSQCPILEMKEIKMPFISLIGHKILLCVIWA